MCLQGPNGRIAKLTEHFSQLFRKGSTEDEHASEGNVQELVLAFCLPRVHPFLEILRNLLCIFARHKANEFKVRGLDAGIIESNEAVEHRSSPTPEAVDDGIKRVKHWMVRHLLMNQEAFDEPAPINADKVEQTPDVQRVGEVDNGLNLVQPGEASSLRGLVIRDNQLWKVLLLLKVFFKRRKQEPSDLLRRQCPQFPLHLSRKLGFQPHKLYRGKLFFQILLGHLKGNHDDLVLWKPFLDDLSNLCKGIGVAHQERGVQLYFFASLLHLYYNQSYFNLQIYRLLG